MKWVDRWTLIYLAAVLGSMPGVVVAQQPGSPQYNNTYLPGHGVGDTRRSDPADRWGAYAVSNTNHLTGFVSHERSKELAAEAAIKMCRERGGGDCTVEFTVVNSCSAVASSDDTNGWAIQGSLRRAERAAKESCGKASCSVIWSACSFAGSER